MIGGEGVGLLFVEGYIVKGFEVGMVILRVVGSDGY